MIKLPTRQEAIEKVEVHRERIIAEAQEIIDEWDWEEGGCCGYIAEEICDILRGYEDLPARCQSSQGEPHVWVVIPVDDGIVNVDIPWRLYESFISFWHYEPTYMNLEPSDLVIEYVDVSPEQAGIDLEYM